jgi:hypothetical protein
MSEKKQSWWETEQGTFVIFAVGVSTSMIIIYLLGILPLQLQLQECQEDLELIEPYYLKHTRCLLPMHEGEIVIRTDEKDFKFDLKCQKIQFFDLRQQPAVERECLEDFAWDLYKDYSVEIENFKCVQESKFMSSDLFMPELGINFCSRFSLMPIIIFL